MSVKMSISQAVPEYSPPEQLPEVNGKTVKECLDELVKKSPNLERWLFDEKGELHEYLDIYLNKESTYPDLLTKPVKDGDELHILCIIGGG